MDIRSTDVFGLSADGRANFRGCDVDHMILRAVAKCRNHLAKSGVVSLVINDEYRRYVGRDPELHKSLSGLRRGTVNTTLG